MKSIRGIVLSLTVLSVLLCTGCGPGRTECREAPSSVDVGAGEAGFSLSVVGKRSTRTSHNFALPCVDVSGFRSSNYADTLVHSTLRTSDTRVSIIGLDGEAGTMDFVIGSEGYFPIKVIDMPLMSGNALYEDRLILYPVDSPVSLAGQLMFFLKDGQPLSAVLPSIEAVGDHELIEEIAGYRIELKSVDSRILDQTTLRLANTLARQPSVRSVAPVAHFSSVY